ncbi:ATP-grasp domain-containing protein [Streptomyces termitum]|uniref:ATP-grasp domain-containing protein n=1 Tax=Streptomyces termitum TaxID=67368 RepID=UPI0033BCDEB0
MTPTFVMLEMLNPMLEVARAAKARGLRIVVVNNTPLQTEGPYAVPEGFVDELVTVDSWSDPLEIEKVLLDVHRRHHVVGTYAGFEPVLPYDAMLRELAGLPHTGADDLRALLDKNQVRDRLREHGLTTLGSATLDEALTWTEWPWAGRAVLKPANGTGSALCFIVDGLDQLRKAVDTFDEVEIAHPLMREYITRTRGYVLEEEAKGELLSVESLVCKGEPHPIGLMGRYVLAKDPVVEMGFQFPYHHPRAAEIFEKAKDIHRVMGFHNGATQIEMMVPDEGPVELIDFNPRLAGTASMVLFGEAYDRPYAELLAALGLGEDIDFGFIGDTVRYGSEMILLPPPGLTRYESVDFPEPTFCHRRSRKPGDELSGRADQLDGIGMFVITAPTAAELHTAALRARRETRVNGEPLGDNENNVLAASPHIGRDLA